jgi:pilus assembly protein CpaE
MGGPEKIRVLIVDDVAETRENIRKLLQFEGEVEVVGAARSGREAIELTQETKPDVVLMDINMPDMDGLQATEVIRKKVPTAQIVILSVQNDQNYLRRAMVAGARDFLSKPPMMDELSAAIKRSGAFAHEEKARQAQNVILTNANAPVGQAKAGEARGKVIVVYSPKGGTGATTLAVNLSVALHNPETKVALVDGNLQFGDVAVFLNEASKNTILDLAPRVDELDSDIVSEVMINHSLTGINVLAAPIRPENAEKISAEQFQRVLQFLRTMYEYVVVDTASYLTEIVLSAMEMADLIVLLATQDIPSIKNAKSFLNLTDSLRIPRQKIVFVMNRFDKRIAISAEKVGESLKQEVGGIIPFEERIVSSSVNKGVPFILDNKSQPIGRAVLSLAETIHERISKLETPTEKEPAAKR